MTRRWFVLLLLASVAVPVPALAQGGGGENPFGPLPQPAPPAPETPEPERIETEEEDDGLGGTAFWLSIGTTGALFLVIGFLIVRDMRKTTGTRRKPRRLRGRRPAAAAADALAGDGRHQPGSHKARAKAQQRAKTKAARKQRRKTRSR